MKLDVEIKLFIPFTEEETKLLDEQLKKENSTLEEHIKRGIQNLLILDADVPESCIDVIEVKKRGERREQTVV